MEKLYYTRLHAPVFKEKEVGVQDPIQLDNKAFNIENGDVKSLDYLDYTSTMTKGALAAKGIIKLPSNSYSCGRDYGAYSPYEQKEELIETKSTDEDGDLENPWNNIFLNRADEDIYAPTDFCGTYN